MAEHTEVSLYIRSYNNGYILKNTQKKHITYFSSRPQMLKEILVISMIWKILQITWTKAAYL